MAGQRESSQLQRLDKQSVLRFAPRLARLAHDVRLPLAAGASAVFADAACAARAAAVLGRGGARHGHDRCCGPLLLLRATRVTMLTFGSRRPHKRVLSCASCRLLCQHSRLLLLCRVLQSAVQTGSHRLPHVLVLVL